MVVFDNPTLTNNVNTNLPSKVVTLSATTQSISVTNYSHYFLRVDSDTRNGFGELPPFTTQTFNCRPGQQVTFTIDVGTVNAQTQVSESVSYSESTLAFATGLQSLSLPVYAQNVIAAKLKEDTGSGFLQAVGTSQLKSFTNQIAYFEFFNMDTQGRTVYLNFNNPTTGGYADLRLLPDPNKQGQGAYWAVPADYNQFYYQGGDFQVVAWYSSP